MEITKLIEEQIKDLDKVLEEIDATIASIAAQQEPVLWFVKYKTIRGIVKYLPCIGITEAREWAERLNGQIMKSMF